MATIIYCHPESPSINLTFKDLCSKSKNCLVSQNMMAFCPVQVFQSLFLNLFKMLYNLSYLLKLLSLYDYLFFLLSFILLLTITSFCALDSLHFNIPSEMKKFNERNHQFNKIQSWLEQIESIEHTQRMLLTGGSKMFEGSKLKSKPVHKTKRPLDQNFIQINNEAQVFKISSFDDQKVLSKTFTPLIRQKSTTLKKPPPHSQNISPRQKHSSSAQRLNSTIFPRQTFKLNTKQLLFKMKKIKRVQSASVHQSNKNKINRILDWKGDLIEVTKSPLKGTTSQKILSKIITSPSTPTNINRTDSSKNAKNQNNLNLKNLFVNKLSDQFRDPIEFRKISSSNKNKEKNGTLSQSIKTHKVDPRIKLELQISQKLFNMQKNNKKAHLISRKFKEVS